MEIEAVDKFRKIILATGAGLLAGAMGVEITGYLAAITVPEEYFVWFQENLNTHIGFVLLYTVQNILGFGLLLLAAGYLVTRRLLLSPLVAALCLLTGFWLYSTIGVALVYGGPVSNPIPSLNVAVINMLVISILFLAFGVALGKRYNHAMHATSA
jgi:hypothetical protein